MLLRLFGILIATLLLPGHALEILYLEESASTFGSGSTPKSTTISAVSPGFTSTQKFGFSAWFKKASWSSYPTMDSFFQVSNNIADYYGNGRVMLASSKYNDTWFFYSASTTINSVSWSTFVGYQSYLMLYTGFWVFLSLAIDNTQNTLYGFWHVYYSGVEYEKYSSTTPASGSLYSISPTTKIYWGGDTSNKFCLCDTQYVRFYIDYAASSQAEMLNLVLMNPQNKLYYLHFQSDSTVNSNQTTVVEYFTNATQGTLTSVKGKTTADTTGDPDIGPYNVLECRPGKYLSFSTGESNANGLVIAMNIKFYSGFTGTENIFSIRSSTTNFVSLVAELDTATSKIQISQQSSGGTWSTVLTTSAITFDTWYRLIFELVQAQPTEFNVGMCSVRVWINGVSTTRTLFCDFQNNKFLFADMSNAQLELCSRKVSGSSTTIDSTKDSKSDIVDFMWFKGAEYLFTDSTDSTCELKGFISQLQTVCLQCKPGYVLVDRECQASCPTTHFLHSPTNSCQKCQYSLYYDTSGICTACNTAGYSISGSACIACDPSCSQCTGTAPNQCSSCYSGTYLKVDDNTCTACTAPGYYSVSATQTCELCDTSCKTCSGSAATNCQTCYTGKYLLVANSSCVSCNVDGYYQDTGTQTCKACDTSCKTCSDSAATNCLSCYLGKYLLAANNSCVSCDVDGYYQDTGTQTCKACDANCKTCSGSSTTSCLSCYSGKYFLAANNSCVSCNVDGYYADTSTLTCQTCDLSCKTCTGSTSTSCLSCYSGKYWLSSNNSCVDCSASGYFIDVPTQTCFTCDPSCLTCSGSSATSCLSCYSGKYLLELNNSCMSCDIDGYYQDISTQRCRTCDSSCKTCNGPTASHCLSCYSGMQLNESNSCINKTSSAFTEFPHLTVTLMSTATTTQAALQMQSATTSLLPVLIRGASTTAVLMVNFVSDVLLFRFINVRFPGNFVDFCKNLYVNFLPNIYLPYEEKHNITNVPEGKFEEFSMSTVIFGNCGNTLDREFIALSLICVLIFLAWVTKKLPKIHSVMVKLRDSYKWNIFLTFFMGDFGELYLFSMVHLRHNKSKSWYAWYGSVASILFLASYPLLVGYFIYLLNRKTAPKVGDEEKVEKVASPWREVPKSINMITTDFKTKHWVQRNFMMLLLVEGLINDLSYFLLQDYGTFQAILYVCNTAVFFIVGAVVYRPYTSKLQNWVFSLDYFVKVLLGLLAVFIGVSEASLSEEKLEYVGLVLIGLIVTAIGLNTLIVVWVLFSTVFRACKARIRRRTQVKPEGSPSSAKTPAKAAALSIDCLENPASDPFRDFSAAFKRIVVGTSLSDDKADTPTASMLALSSARYNRRKATLSATRFLNANPDTSENGDINHHSSFRVDSPLWLSPNYQPNLNDSQTKEVQDSSASESHFRRTAKKVSQKPIETLNATRILRFNFDDD